MSSKIKISTKELDELCTKAYHLRAGIGVKQDLKAAFEIFKRGPELHSAYLTWCLAEAFFNGEGCKQNTASALEYYELAGLNGEDGAYNTLGYIYFYGEEDIEEDLSKAVFFYEKAAQAGNSDALTNLGKCYTFGNGVSKNHTKAFQYFKEATSHKFHGAYFYLGKAYLYGQGTPKDIEKAVYWLWKSIKNSGNPQAFLEYGLCFYNGWGRRKSPKRAVYYFQQAIDYEVEDAFYYLGKCYVDGIGIQQDKTKGLILLKKAKKLGVQLP